MDARSLESAVEPVREHLKSDKINVNTVLAAHLRAHGENPSGDVWQRAKEALERGASFSEAAALAAGTKTGSGGSDQVNDSKGSRPKRSLQSKPAKPSTRETEGAGEQPPPLSDQVVRLDWFPKPFGAGDMDGEGGKKLLGQPNLQRTAVLVREAAQNSWDARLDDVGLEFTLDLRELSADQRKTLLGHVITDEPDDLGVRASIESGARVLEIWDRGATGLAGPTRNDLAVPKGQRTDFIDFVFTVGAPRDKHLGGGTYGFGKTISYVISRCGTVVIWTRTRTPDGLEHRLIGSSFGASYEEGGYRYTGRHWWGRMTDPEGRIEPVVGDDARDLGERIFGRQFEGDETGTSILIIDPDLGGADLADDIERLRDAVLWHLWPKLVVEDHGPPPMRIEVRRDGKSTGPIAADDHPILTGFVQCLRAVRAVQHGNGDAVPADADWPFPIEVREMRCHRPDELLGHIAMTRFPAANGSSRVESGGDVEPITEITQDSHHVALMRHKAELVVRYLERRPTDIAGIQWAAVFKPVEATDDSYAKSEPPAHDDWLPKFVSHRGERRQVNVGLTRVREAINDWLQDHPDGVPVQAGRSTAHVADALAGLVGALAGNRTEARKSGRNSSSKPRPRASIMESKLGPEFGHRRRAAIRVKAVHPEGERVSITPDLRIGVEGGSETNDGSVRFVSWSEAEPDLAVPSPSNSDDNIVLPDGDSIWCIIEQPTDLAADIDFKATGEL